MRDCSQKLGKSIDCDAICSQSTTLATSFFMLKFIVLNIVIFYFRAQS